MVEMGKQLVEINTNFNQLENLGAKFKRFQRQQTQNQLEIHFTDWLSDSMQFNGKSID